MWALPLTGDRKPFPGPGRKWQVSSNGGTQPRWSHDGKELFYVSPEAKLTAVRIVLPFDGQAVALEAPVPLFSVRLANGTGTGGVGALGKQQYAVAADGRFLLDAVADEAPAPITIVQNWAAGLKR